MRTRGLWLTMTALACGASLTIAGCAGPGDGAPAAAASTLPDATATSGPSAATVSPSGPRSPSPASTTRAPAAPPPAGSAPPWCQLADLRFGLSVGSSGGEWIPASVTMTNVSGRRCSLSGYLILKWRDADGKVMPVTVTHRPDPQTPHTIGVPPGAKAIAGLGWQRYKNAPPAPAVPCPPFPATLDIWLPPTVQNPHPERGPSGTVRWVSGDSAGLCGGKAELSPVDIIL